MDMDAIENAVMSLTECLPAPYDNPHSTAFFRASMFGVALKPVHAQLIAVRMDRFLVLPEMTS
jgi:hypothetical protein